MEHDKQLTHRDIEAQKDAEPKRPGEWVEPTFRACR